MAPKPNPTRAANEMPGCVMCRTEEPSLPSGRDLVDSSDLVILPKRNGSHGAVSFGRSSSGREARLSAHIKGALGQSHCARSVVGAAVA